MRKFSYLFEPTKSRLAFDMHRRDALNYFERLAVTLACLGASDEEIDGVRRLVDRVRRRAKTKIEIVDR